MGSEVRKVQNKILEIIKFVDKICRANGIVYYITAGTALGAVRHKGFIPWDDDLDIFMTPENYEKFKKVFYEQSREKFYLQEWKAVENYLEYAKVRMNGTTLIEPQFRNNKEIHQGIYIDIFILHKCPTNRLAQKKLFLGSKFATIVGLSQRNWKPKNTKQKLVLKMLKILPTKILTNYIYQKIYQYDALQEDYQYCFFITGAKFDTCVFEREWYDTYAEYQFEDVILLGPTNIENYLKKTYGDYMTLPPLEKRQQCVHAEIWDTQKNYTEYIK